MDSAKYRIIEEVQLKESVTYEVIEDADKKLKKIRKKLGELQNTMYAEGKYSVLICLQGMDTSGKDSLIREVFKQCNVRGVEVHSFKVPTALELKHDFLWRHYIALPAKGKVGVFNRTHYENVLVTRVHPEYIFSENIPTVKTIDDLDDAFYEKRMERINEFEKHVSENGTIILKFFLNLSKEEQKNRLLRRLNLPEKNWKFSAGDLEERKLWERYQFCYEEVLNKTSTNYAPWFVIPADDKKTSRYIVAEILLEELTKYGFKEPLLSAKMQSQVAAFKEQLRNE
ncbi:PPK2 family polyphosphate kinase [Tenacibaculum maritimum]|uniref:Polyphosphate kinase 2 n=1 Tax=Tenacibaculum maritimum NCIMB 2154 TaxID=1349785 RepID=A0A2H1E8M6_9FLAO|nr:phosphate--nucleotide phosphotransferase [Tenacibaculum maritimum]MCD9582821.1 phosphate--nucleotide phosphotransferase [Tenacibaculum maritimum]MCD9583728.1 phosphate--nucleotide phosphotransferase [Tenacibaculum maritimum]MCD9611543.1 phosphate--nucleotide phosphotransferase [Tenacibaculum maritimum]MCD9619456.1 phosphate--nucleotide phosphotransferase [Tenacibaculum maritimum]MCD9626203.1 phosphate--nucleotide phosphotransferase [Tenacibaculum maritimum]